MTNMAQTEASMFESVTAKTKNLPSLSKQERPKRECRARKRPYDAEFYTSKRLKCDGADADEQQIDGACTFALTGSDSEEDNDTESKCSTSDETEQALIKQVDDNSDVEDVEDETASVNFAKVSSDQNRHFPVVLNQTAIHQQQQSLSRQSKRLISQFKYLYDHGLRKSVQPTNGPDLSSASNGEVQSEKVRWELGNTFNRLDLFKEGYCVLSNEPFPFHSLCYMVSRSSSAYRRESSSTDRLDS